MVEGCNRRRNWEEDGRTSERRVGVAVFRVELKC
jgi:hypothetical protein